MVSTKANALFDLSTRYLQTGRVNNPTGTVINQSAVFFGKSSISRTNPADGPACDTRPDASLRLLPVATRLNSHNIPGVPASAEAQTIPKEIDDLFVVFASQEEYEAAGGYEKFKGKYEIMATPEDIEKAGGLEQLKRETLDAHERLDALSRKCDDVTQYMKEKFKIDGKVLSAGWESYPQDFKMYYFESTDSEVKNKVIIQVGDGEYRIYDAPEGFNQQSFQKLYSDLSKLDYDFCNPDYDPAELRRVLDEYLLEALAEKKH